MAKNTLILAALIVFSYFALSETLLYIPTGQLVEYGFSLGNPLGIITYAFVHVSPIHLIGNLIFLIPIGLIAEKKLRNEDYFSIFFMSAVVSGFTYGVLQPQNVLVGASAAISGLMAAAFMIDVKKTFVSIVAVSLLASAASPYVSDYTMQKIDELKNKTAVIQENITSISEKIEVAAQSNDTAAVQVYEAQKQDAINQMNDTLINQMNIEIGLAREKESKVESVVHFAGAMTGIIYLFAFRRDIIWKMPSQLISRRRLRKSSKKS